jgi:hypothetical protein
VINQRNRKEDFVKFWLTLLTFNDAMHKININMKIKK